MFIALFAVVFLALAVVFWVCIYPYTKEGWANIDDVTSSWGLLGIFGLIISRLFVLFNAKRIGLSMDKTWWDVILFTLFQQFSTEGDRGFYRYRQTWGKLEDPVETVAFVIDATQITAVCCVSDEITTIHASEIIFSDRPLLIDE